MGGESSKPESEQPVELEKDSRDNADEGSDVVEDAGDDKEMEEEEEYPSGMQTLGEDMEDEAVVLQRRNELARRIFSSLRRDIIPELDYILARKVLHPLYFLLPPLLLI